MIPIWNKKFAPRSLIEYESLLLKGDAIGTKLITDFEEQTAEIWGRQFALLCSSGTGALLAALFYLKEQLFSDISLPSTTWVANLNTALVVGMTPHFRETDPTTLLAKPDSNEICSGDRRLLSEIIHISGRLSDLRGISKNKILEDFSQGHYSVMPDGRLAGTLGSISVASTSVTKALSTVHGGIILTDDPEAARWMREFIKNGVDSNLVEAWNHIGLNFKPNGANASIGLHELQVRTSVVEKLFLTKSLYVRYLPNCSGCSIIDHLPGEVPLYIEVLCSKAKGLLGHLKLKGIQCKAPPPPLFSADYVTYQPEHGGSREHACNQHLAWRDQVLMLPSGPDLSEDMIKVVCKEIRDYLRAG